MKKSVLKTSALVTLMSALLAVSCQEQALQGSSPAPTAQTEVNQLIALLSENGSDYALPQETDLDRIPQDPKNPLTSEKVALGKLLFHETALSGVSKNGRNGTWSCASCHFARAGFQDKRVQSLADGGMGDMEHRQLIDENTPHANLDSPNVHSPTILNLAYQENVLWNGMAGGLDDNLNHRARWDKTKPHGFNFLGYGGAETQAIIALGAHRQTHDNMKYETAKEPVTLLDAYPEYVSRFQKIFPGEPMTREKLGLLLAAYERTVLPNKAPFQRFIQGDTKALSAQEIKGARLFFGKAQCASCHTGASLNSPAFYSVGFKDMEVEFGNAPDESTRKGRGGFTGNPEDDYKFKVPQLYNLKDVPALGHGGSFQSDSQQSALEKVVRYKLKGVAENPEVPAKQLAPGFTAMQSVDFSEAEIQSLIAFVSEGLYDPDLKRYEPTSLPSGKRIINDDD